MSEHDETLRKALEENLRLRSQRETSLREGASADYSARLRWAERIYWSYAIVCVAIGVSALNYFTLSFDTKTLVGCAVLMLVVYETTVLLKLWFATATMKMSVLKDVKLLRLEVARLATAVGVESPAEPPVKYEPLRGAPPWERRLWLAAVVLVAMITSSGSIHWLTTGRDRLTDDTLVTLADDGTATSVTEMAHTYNSVYQPKDFPYFAPKDWKIRFVDAEGHDMPVAVTPEKTHNRHQVTLTDGIYKDGKMRYTRISEAPHSATLADGVWTFKNDVMYSKAQNQFNVTVCLPSGAELVSAEPEPTLQFDQDGRNAVRFQGSRSRNERFAYSVKYKLPGKQ
ncbi:MAG: DUF6768 family protein [Thermoguttaceae bacterium]